MLFSNNKSQTQITFQTSPPPVIDFCDLVKLHIRINPIQNISKLKHSNFTKRYTMARLISLIHSKEELGGIKFTGPHILFMLCMIVVSMSILSMVIFACGDSNDHKTRKKHRHDGGGGDEGGDGGDGGGDHGGGVEHHHGGGGHHDGGGGHHHHWGGGDHHHGGGGFGDGGGGGGGGGGC